MDKKRIVHLIQALENGGCENFLLRLLPRVTDYEHIVITLSHTGSLAPLFKKDAILVCNINQKNIFDIPAYFRLIKILKQYNPDIILTYLFHADIIGRFIVQSCTAYKVVPWLRTTYNHPKYYFVRIIERFSHYLVPHYLANSEAVKDFYVKQYGISEQKITVIPNGIDIDIYKNATPNETIKKELKISSEDTVFICVANLHINKGHRYLLEAFEEVCQRCHSGLDPESTKQKSIHLLIVGDGNERPNLERKIELYTSKKYVHFLGQRQDVPSLLKISHIFVLPTLFEGMSNAIMEAMASGLPVITTDIPENRELVTRENEGMLVEPINSLSLTNAICLLLSAPEKMGKLRNNAKINIEENFSLAKTVKKLESFLITRVS